MLFCVDFFKSLLGFCYDFTTSQEYDLCKMRSSVPFIMTGITHGGKSDILLNPDGINTLIIEVARPQDGRAMATCTHLSNNRVLSWTDNSTSVCYLLILESWMVHICQMVIV